jgi:6-phosphogluconate dehydrogenase
LKKIAAQVEGDGPCVTYIGPGGAGNYVKVCVFLVLLTGWVDDP